MLAAVLEAPQKFGLTHIDTPHAGPGEIVLAVEATTLCGTDLRLISGEKTAGVRPGVVMGHEIAGRIAEIGDGVTGYRVGAQATVSIVVSCGRCTLCLAGREHLCEALELIGYALDGGFAEYLLVPARAVAAGNVVQLDHEIPPTGLALAEPLSAVLNAHDQIRVRPGDLVAILGFGPIGALHAMVSRASGAGGVLVSSRSAARAESGPTDAVDLASAATGDEFRQELLDWTGGRLADVVIVCAGMGELANQSLRLATPGGRVNWFAGFPKGSLAEVDPNLVHYNELTVTGGSNARRDHVRRAVGLMERGIVRPGALVTHQFKLSEIDQAIEAVRQRAGWKVAVLP
ncbi:MAG TPA: alcohol dehydrogenase catalytic domain-containing protein [Propionibacteriaceae bacterium]|nr:alcohol dehydrogenase catalytic domain-containing protein [Propionibacteriaceae bacterium]